MAIRGIITKPFQHQITANEKMHGRTAFALFAEMGTGKSLTVLIEFIKDAFEGWTDTMIVVAPKGAYLNWPDEIKAHLDPITYKHLQIFIWRSGMPDNEISKMVRQTNKAFRILVINVEAFGRSERAKDIVTKFMNGGHQPTMVIDESTTIKSERANRTQALIKLGKLAGKRRILTGLPTPQSPLDLYSQFEFLDPGILNFPNFVTFRARYAKFKTIQTGRLERYWSHEDHCFKFRKQKIQVVDGYRNAADLQAKIEPFVYRVRKADCLDLPPKVYQWRNVEMTEEQKRVYAKLKAEATAQLDSGAHVTATIVLTRMIRLQQILCGYSINDETGEIETLKSNRLDVLMELLADHAGKAIIWAPWDFCIRDISARIVADYGPETCARFWGDNARTRHDDETRWKNDPVCRFMVSTQAAGGKGNTWVQGDLNIYYANSYNLEHRMQSEDRAHRSGQTKTVRNVDLVVRGTTDEKAIRALRSKLNIADLIIGDGHRQWLI